MKTDQKSEWTRARGLLEGMRHHARSRQSTRILLGKELLELKTRLHLKGGGGDRKSNGQTGHLISEGRRWDEICRGELGIARRTADRYITVFEKAAEYSRTLPVASCLLFAPTAELTGDEIETLAEFVEDLVDGMTRSSLRIELGLDVEETDDDEESDPNPTQDFQESLEQEALIFFASIPRKLAAMRKAIAPFRDHGKYHFYLHKLPLDDGRPGKPSLLGIKAGLEAILQDGLRDVLADLSEAIAAKSTGKPPKPARQKSPTQRRK